MSEKIYAAYGSNLNVGQMALRCPEAVQIHKAVLEDHALVFRGGRYSAVATIEPQEGSHVPVMLWSISERDEKNLDLYEGYPNLYRKKTMTFHADGQETEAMVYVMTPGHELGLPSIWYYDAILAGYKDCGLEPAVLAQALTRTMDMISTQKSSFQEMGELRMW